MGDILSDVEEERVLGLHDVQDCFPLELCVVQWPFHSEVRGGELKCLGSLEDSIVPVVGPDREIAEEGEAH